MAKYKVVLEAEIDGEANILGAVEETMMIVRAFANDREIFGAEQPPESHWQKDYHWQKDDGYACIEVTRIV